MKHLVSLLFCITLLYQTSIGQTTPTKKIYNQDFNWTIFIPDHFQSVSAEEWAKMQGKGEAAMEKTFEADVVNKAKTIFVYKTGQLNYIEANYQPFNVAVKGDYVKGFKAVNDMLYQTFRTQMPDLKIDTLYTKEAIDNLEFQVFKMKVTYPNNMALQIAMYSRLFDKKEFTVNLMYIDPKAGQLMSNALLNSKFSK